MSAATYDSEGEGVGGVGAEVVAGRAPHPHQARVVGGQLEAGAHQGHGGAAGVPRHLRRWTVDT